MKLNRVLLFVDDLEKMTKFYGNIIGLGEYISESDDFVTFKTEGAELCLHQIPTQYLSTDNSYKPREESYVKIIFYSDCPLLKRDELIKKGVRMKEAVKFDDLILCDGFDAEGNVFQISNR